MSYFKTIRFHLFALIFIALLVIFTYWSLPSTFFQQDEWQTLASNIYYISKGITGVIESFLPTSPLSHFNPFARVFSWFEYMFYKTNFTLYAWQSISLHILNAGLLYYFIFFWFKSKKIAIISALFFGVNSIPNQAVTWVAAANSYEIPVTFILLSLIFFQRFLTYKKHQRINIFLSLTTLFISLLFHEIGIFLFLFYPVIFFLNADLQRKKMSRFFSYSLALFMFVFFLIRLPFFFGFITSLPEATDISRPPIIVYPYRIISIAMKSFAGSLIPEKSLISISEGVTRLAYPQFITPDNLPNPFIAQSIVFDLVSYALTFFIICIMIMFLRFIPDKNMKKILIWTLFFIPTSLIPYGFVLGKAGYASILEPKFFYVSSIGVSILVAIISYSLRFSKKKILKVTVFILLSLYLLYHMYAIRTYLSDLVEIGEQRKAFLTNIKSSYEKLPQNVVFFTQSDTAYYGMPDNEKILPVQIGFGKMLMIWYQQEEKFPACLYENNFLLPLLAQGYKECEGRGFGYFRDYEKLEKSVWENSINPEEIIAYSWEGSSKTFKDITVEIRMIIKAGLP